MGQIDFNMVEGCGECNRVIFRYGEICFIGCFEGTYEEAKEAIGEKYNQPEYIKYKDEYLTKLNMLFVIMVT